MMHPTTQTPTVTTESFANAADVNVVQAEMVKPSLRTRIVTKVAVARLAVLQTALQARDGLVRLSERFFSLFKRSKNNPVPAPAVSPFVESPVNKSPVKQDSSVVLVESSVNRSPAKQNSPVDQQLPLAEFKDTNLTPPQTFELTPLSSNFSPISPLSPRSPLDDQLTPDLSPFTLDTESTEPSTPLLDELAQPTPTEETTETSKEVTDVNQNGDSSVERVTGIYQRLIEQHSHQIKNTLLVAGSMVLGGLIGYYTSGYNKGYSDGWKDCTNKC